MRQSKQLISDQECNGRDQLTNLECTMIQNETNNTIIILQFGLLHVKFLLRGQPLFPKFGGTRSSGEVGLAWQSLGHIANTKLNSSITHLVVVLHPSILKRVMVAHISKGGWSSFGLCPQNLGLVGTF